MSMSRQFYENDVKEIAVPQIKNEEKVLGITWDRKSDVLKFQVQSEREVS